MASYPEGLNCLIASAAVAAAVAVDPEHWERSTRPLPAFWRKPASYLPNQCWWLPNRMVCTSAR